MAVSTRPTVWCDVDGCDEHAEAEATTVTKARKEWNKAGWQSRAYVDLCPEHHAERKSDLR